MLSVEIVKLGIGARSPRATRQAFGACVFHFVVGCVRESTSSRGLYFGRSENSPWCSAKINSFRFEFITWWLAIFRSRARSSHLPWFPFVSGIALLWTILVALPKGAWSTFYETASQRKDHSKIPLNSLVRLFGAVMPCFVVLRGVHEKMSSWELFSGRFEALRTSYTFCEKLRHEKALINTFWAGKAC